MFRFTPWLVRFAFDEVGDIDSIHVVVTMRGIDRDVNLVGQMTVVMTPNVQPGL